MENKNLPLITVGIPFYNTEKYLANAINSVINQTYANWELLLMDDGSSDKSVEIAKAFEAKDKRIKVFSDGKNFKLPTRLNQLSKLANGEFYARMDADDMMHPDRLKTQVEFLLNNPEVDLLGTGLVAIDEHNNIIGIRKGKSHTHFRLNEIISGGWCVHPTITGKTEWFKKNQYDEKLTRTEDFDLWIRTVEQSSFCKIDFLGLYYREESALSLKKYKISTKQTIKLYWKNVKIIGFFNFITYSLLKTIKFLVYLLFSMTKSMDIIVNKRSEKISPKDLNYHNQILKKTITSDY